MVSRRSMWEGKEGQKVFSSAFWRVFLLRIWNSFKFDGNFFWYLWDFSDFYYKFKSKLKMFIKNIQKSSQKITQRHHSIFLTSHGWINSAIYNTKYIMSSTKVKCIKYCLSIIVIGRRNLSSSTLLRLKTLIFCGLPGLLSYLLCFIVCI